MKVLVVGGSGMLGHKLVDVLRADFDVWTSLRGPAGSYQRYGLIDAGKIVENVDATSFESIARTLTDVRPDAVINAVGAIKHVAEGRDPVAGTSLNTLLPHRLALACRLGSMRLIHVSTDCVFSGSRGGYSEQDPPDATDVYGRTKQLGEVAGENCLTLRTSIIGRELRTTHGLVEWFLSQRGKTVEGFTQAVFSGVTTRTLAGWVGRILCDYPDLSGLYHAGADPIAKYDLLCALKRWMRLDVEITASDRLRIDRSLTSDRFRAVTGLAVPSWDHMLEELADESPRYDRWRG